MNKLYQLFKLQCADLLVLEEMEWNGIMFDTKAAREKAVTIQKELDEIYQQVLGSIDGVPINLASNDHVSSLLYGGLILEDSRIPIGVYKTGAKVGQVRYKIVTKEYELPRLVEPLKGTETKKSTPERPFYEVNDNVLRSLKLNKEAKKMVALLKRYSELEKLRGTYLIGYSDLINKMNWSKDMLHTNFSQNSVITGRLSSSRPNMQNCDPSTKIYCKSRYDK